jgi:hypothetical protein
MHERQTAEAEGKKLPKLHPPDFVRDPKLKRCPVCDCRVYHHQLRFVGPILHDCRRAAATNLIRRGVPMITAMGMLGHRTTKLFARYKLDDPAAKQDALLMADAAREKELAELQAGSKTGSTPEPQTLGQALGVPRLVQ